MPEGAALAEAASMSPVSVSKSLNTMNVYSSLLGLIIPPFLTSSPCFSNALCLIGNTFLYSALLPCWQLVSRAVNLCMRNQCLAEWQREGNIDPAMDSFIAFEHSSSRFSSCISFLSRFRSISSPCWKFKQFSSNCSKWEKALVNFTTSVQTRILFLMRYEAGFYEKTKTIKIQNGEIE